MNYCNNNTIDPGEKSAQALRTVAERLGQTYIGSGEYDKHIAEIKRNAIFAGDIAQNELAGIPADTNAYVQAGEQYDQLKDALNQAHDDAGVSAALSNLKDFIEPHRKSIHELREQVGDDKAAQNLSFGGLLSEPQVEYVFSLQTTHCLFLVLSVSGMQTGRALFLLPDYKCQLVSQLFLIRCGWHAILVQPCAAPLP